MYLIEEFLKRFGYFSGAVDDYFGPDTFVAVKRFQLDHAAEILAPWGHTNPTGYWYITTRRTANRLVGCPEENKGLVETRI